MSAPKEIWPFVLPDGQKIYAHMYYAFNDVDHVTSLGMDVYTSTKTGCLTPGAVVSFLHSQLWLSDEDISSNPDDLGAYPYAILSGQQYIDKITSFVTDGDLSDFGKWSTK